MYLGSEKSRERALKFFTTHTKKTSTSTPAKPVTSKDETTTGNQYNTQLSTQRPTRHSDPANNKKVITKPGTKIDEAGAAVSRRQTFS